MARVPSRKRILVVEDEPLIAMMLEDLLEDLGIAMVGPARNLAESDVLIDKRETVGHQIDAAILDINLGGERSHRVAERLRREGIPFVFATGHDSAGDARFDDVQLIHKPYCREQIAEAVERVLGGA